MIGHNSNKRPTKTISRRLGFPDTALKMSFYLFVVYIHNVNLILSYIPGALEASSKWVGKTKIYSNGSEKSVGKHPFSIMIKQKSG